MTGEIQRAELFRNVDELLAWQKTFELKQAELIAWQHGIQKSIAELRASLTTTLEGCQILMETDTLLSGRCDELDRRIDIVNKRLRRIEDAVKQLQEMSEPGR